MGIFIGATWCVPQAHAQFAPQCTAYGAVPIVGGSQQQRCDVVRLLTQVPYSDLRGMQQILITPTHEFFDQEWIAAAWVPGLIVIKPQYILPEVLIHEVGHNADWTRMGPGRMGELGLKYETICISDYACQGIPAEWFAEAYQMCHTNPLRLWQMAPQAWNEICSR